MRFAVFPSCDAGQRGTTAASGPFWRTLHPSPLWLAGAGGASARATPLPRCMLWVMRMVDDQLGGLRMPRLKRLSTRLMLQGVGNQWSHMGGVRTLFGARAVRFPTKDILHQACLLCRCTCAACASYLSSKMLIVF